MHWPTAHHLQMPAIAPQKEILFLSDLHLGLFKRDTERTREEKWLQFLRIRKKKLWALFLLGDIFDFWYEYKHTVPQGFIRLQAYLGELVEAGIPVHYFSGNHDLWLGNYFSKELGLHIHKQPLSISIGETNLYIAHGDGLGKGDTFYKICKVLFSSPLCQALFRSLHPDIGIWMARRWSRSKHYPNTHPDPHHSTPSIHKNSLRLLNYAKQLTQKYPKLYTYYIFGHTHLAQHIHLSQEATYINLGDGIYTPSYGILNSHMKFSLHKDHTLSPEITLKL